MFKVNLILLLALTAYVSTNFFVFAQKDAEVTDFPDVEEIPEQVEEKIPSEDEVTVKLITLDEIKQFDEDGKRMWAAAVPLNNSGEITWKYAYLPEVESYNNSEQVQLFRNHMAKQTDNQFHIFYDQRLTNLIEFSGEMYDLYVTDRGTGAFLGHNITWVFIFIKKEDKKSFMFAEHLNNITESLQAKGNYKLAYIDQALDPELVASFDVRSEPHVYVLDGEDGRVYSWDFFLHPEIIEDWILNKDYKNSTLQFDAPRRKTVPQMKLHHDFNFWKFTFMLHVGVHIEVFVAKHVPWLMEKYPFNLIFNHDGMDQFGLKQDRMFRTFAYLALLLLLTMTFVCTKCCRKAFCTRTKYVLKKKVKTN